MARSVTLAVLCLLVGAPVVTPTPVHSQRSYPSAAQCWAGHPPNAVAFVVCPGPSEDFRVCPNSDELNAPYCIPLSDAEKAEIRRRAEIEEAARREAKAAADRRQKMIEDQLKLMGPARRAEAEKYVDMKLAAEKARPKPKGKSEPEMVDCSAPRTRAWEHWPYMSMTMINDMYAKLNPAETCGAKRGGYKEGLVCAKRWKAFGEEMGNCGVYWGCNAEKRTCPAGSKVSPQ